MVSQRDRTTWGPHEGLPSKDEERLCGRSSRQNFCQDGYHTHEDDTQEKTKRPEKNSSSSRQSVRSCSSKASTSSSPEVHRHDGPARWRRSHCSALTETSHWTYRRRSFADPEEYPCLSCALKATERRTGTLWRLQCWSPLKSHDETWPCAMKRGTSQHGLSQS